MRPSGGDPYWSYPPQSNATGCSDVPPDNRHTCFQQAVLFGKCSDPVLTRGNHCARTCGRPPCPPRSPLGGGDALTLVAAVPSLCVDVPPPGSPFSCAQQSAFGKCGESFMLPNYCASE